MTSAGSRGTRAIPGTSARPLRVFISHTTADDAHVAALGERLRAAGIEAFNDGWEVQPGTDFVAWINRRLAECDAGVVVFSSNTLNKPWVDAEISSLIYMRTTEGKPIIPVTIGDVTLPPLLRPLSRRPIEDVQAIMDLLLNPMAPPALGTRDGVLHHRVEVALQRLDGGSIMIDVSLDGTAVAHASMRALPREVVEARARYLEGFRHASARSPEQGERRTREDAVIELGRALGAMCFPGDAREIVEALVAPRVGAGVEVVFESRDAELLGLPFESIRLGNDSLLAMHDIVEIFRRPSGLQSDGTAPLPGPLKILVAVGAPDEEVTPNAVLDHEREVGLILDAVEEVGRSDNAEVRILEVGSPATIAAAFERDAYHVLYVTCHGAPGRTRSRGRDRGRTEGRAGGARRAHS